MLFENIIKSILKGVFSKESIQWRSSSMCKFIGWLLMTSFNTSPLFLVLILMQSTSGCTSILHRRPHIMPTVLIMTWTVCIGLGILAVMLPDSAMSNVCIPTHMLVRYTLVFFIFDLCILQPFIIFFMECLFKRKLYLFLQGDNPERIIHGLQVSLGILSVTMLITSKWIVSRLTLEQSYTQWKKESHRVKRDVELSVDDDHSVPSSVLVLCNLTCRIIHLVVSSRISFGM